MSDPLEQLTNSSYFYGLSQTDLKTVLDLGTVSQFAKGQTFVNEDEEGASVYFILNGRVDVTVSIPGHSDTETIATLKDGEIVGEMTLLGKRRRTANVTARDDVTAVAWQQSDLFKLFESNTNLGYFIMRNMALNIADRLAATNQVLRNAMSIPRGFPL